MKVSQSTINLQEDGTEVLPEEEATSTKPVPEGTKDPLRIINSTHYNQDNTQPYPRNDYAVVDSIMDYSGVQVMQLPNHHGFLSCLRS